MYCMCERNHRCSLWNMGQLNVRQRTPPYTDSSLSRYHRRCRPLPRHREMVSRKVDSLSSWTTWINLSLLSGCFFWFPFGIHSAFTGFGLIAPLPGVKLGIWYQYQTMTLSNQSQEMPRFGFYCYPFFVFEGTSPYQYFLYYVGAKLLEDVL